MKCIIIDDEPLAIEGLELKVARIEFLHLVGTFSDGLSANSFLQENEVDLAFVDIQMPDITGLDLISSLQNPPLVILTTAYSKYALKAYSLEVIDYLLKPIENKRFIKAVNRAKHIYDLMKQDNSLEGVDDNYIYIRADRQFVKIFFEDIVYIRAMKNYVMIYTVDDKMMTAVSLTILFSKLPKDLFGQVNRSFIINTRFINRVNQESVILTNMVEIFFGKSYYKPFIEKFILDKTVKRNKENP